MAFYITVPLAIGLPQALQISRVQFFVSSQTDFKPHYSPLIFRSRIPPLASFEPVKPILAKEIEATLLMEVFIKPDN
jgi:hypothetical protein